MVSDIPAKVILAVDLAMKENSSIISSWKAFFKDAERSFVFLLQIYSEKSVTSLKAKN